MMSGTGTATNLRKPLKHTDHTWPILSDEGASLCLDLLIVGSPGEHGGDNDTNHTQKQVVVLPEGIRIIDICSCQ
jgi:hypothetical protein